MSYRIVILNGERRGERLTVDASPLVIGKSAGCGIRIGDPECAETHAEVSLRGEELFIRSLGEAPPFLVNETASRESRLKHSDVIQIGSTRLFIHEYSEQKGWESLASLRKRRAWLTLGIPLLLVAGIATVVNRFRHETHSPSAAPGPARSAITVPEQNPMLPDDCLVTNIPRIQIAPSVTLTTRPPELVEAVSLLEHTPINPDAEALTAARVELEAGTRFLEEKSSPSPTPLAATNRDEAVADLTNAEASLRATTPDHTTTNSPSSPSNAPASNPSIPQ